MSLATLQSDCVGLLDSFEAAVHAAQEGYRLVYGRYCQLPLPMDVVPEEGTLTACDWSRYVADVQFPWSASPVDMPESLPCGIEYHVSGSADGSRYYTAIVSVVWSGGLYQYRRTYDSAGLISTDDWQEVVHESV